jgi:hypothetical protein
MYLPEDQHWLRAGSLEVGQAIFARDGAVKITSITQLQEPAQVYKLSVAKHHNFCVTEQSFLAHNFGFVIPILAWGAGSITFFEGVTLTGILASIGTALLLKKVQDSTGVEIGATVGADGTLNGSYLPGVAQNSGDSPGGTVSWERALDKDDQIGSSSNTGGSSSCWCGHPCGNYCACGCGCGCGNNPQSSSNNFDEEPSKRKINKVSKTEFFKQTDAIKQNYEHWRKGIYKLKKRGKAVVKNAEYIYWDHTHNDVEVFNRNEIHLGSIDPETLELYKGPVLGREFPD